MTRNIKRSTGRPLIINQTLIHSICRAAESEILPKNIICKRFNIVPNTLQHWIDTGQKCKGKPLGDLTTRQVLCVQFATQLENIYREHERALMQSMQNPETAIVVRLALALSPDWTTVEAAAQ